MLQGYLIHHNKLKVKNVFLCRNKNMASPTQPSPEGRTLRKNVLKSPQLGEI